MIKLRPRQERGYMEIRKAMASGKNRILCVAPPGYGKATLMGYISSRVHKKGGRCFQFVHKKELVENLTDRLWNQFGVRAGQIMAGKKTEKNRRIQVASVATAVRRDLSWIKPDLVMGDESHRLLTNSQLKLYDHFVGPSTPALFFTATPVRVDKKRKFSDYCDHLIQLSTYREEMKDRYLVPTKVFGPNEGTASLEGVKLRMSFGEKDYDKKELSKRYSEERVLSGMFNEWKKYARDKQTMVFNVDKFHNRAVCEFFRSKGVKAECVDESTPKNVRADIVKRFQAGPFIENNIEVLCNIGLFTEGLDAPYAKCVILNYATKSFNKYVQSTARGSRPVWNKDYSDWLKVDGKYYKEYILVLDFGGNTNRFGKLEDYDMFGFDLDGSRKKGEAPTKKCPDCQSIVYASQMTCPECEYLFPEAEKKDNKKYLDEIGMTELSSDNVFMNMVHKMSPNKIYNAPAHILRIIAMLKGYKSQWVYHSLSRRGLYPKHSGSAADWKEFWDWIEQEEINKGTNSLYLRLKNRYVTL